MGDISIIARRLKDGHVQYGWSGNGGYFRVVGARLLMWYQEPDDVDYLFELGQTRLIGKPGSEKGGCSMLDTHDLTGQPFWLSNTERMIFSKIAFIDFGYLYDIDDRWYYVIPGPFRIKMPLELILRNVDEEYREFDYRRRIQRDIAKFIFSDYIKQDAEFAEFLKDEEYDPKEVLEDIMDDERGMRQPLYKLFDNYNRIFRYFDDWILIKTDIECKEIKQIVMRKKEEPHVETCEW